jgi:predicted ATP-grasp superfamily ATP-dependent carboligase
VTTVLVHEYLSAGGALAGAGDAVTDELLRQGRAMRDAMAADLRALPGVDVRCPSHDDWASAVHDADAVWSVAPETDGLLAALCASVPPPKWLGCDARATRVAGSKRATRVALAAAGVPVPDEAGGAGLHVVKPDDGAGATDTFVCGTFDAACARAGDGDVVEQWVDGDAMSATWLCGRRGAELLAINRQRIDVDGQGRVSFHGVEIAVEPVTGERGARLQRLAGKVFAALPGLFGLVGIDFVWHPTRGPVVIEVNPRVTSAYVGLSARLGRNVAGMLLQRWSDG